MSEDDHKPDSRNLSKGNSEDGQDTERKRIRVTGASPWVPRPHSPTTQPPPRRRYRRSDSEIEEQRRLTRTRKQSTVLGGMFAIIALIVFIATRLLAPSVIVTLNGGQGKVLIDGVEQGVTGEILSINPGEHELRVLPDGVDTITEPQVKLHNFRYGIDPIHIEFQLIHRADRRSTPGEPVGGSDNEGGP
ncbi:hypothetical protein BMS3Bbin04_00638 [bacterium BMS3Bbin04]|nr:hypothetical protein BMS3Bbin04_00638 [bacterium BMS3Bbin04]